VVPLERETDLGGGRVRIDLRTPHLAWVVRLLLSAGEAARPVEPAGLVDALRNAARRALSRYDA
jgi:predicted DNA-binding transcriptional regulator YafY